MSSKKKAKLPNKTQKAKPAAKKPAAKAVAKPVKKVVKPAAKKPAPKPVSKKPAAKAKPLPAKKVAVQKKAVSKAKPAPKKPDAKAKAAPAKKAQPKPALVKISKAAAPKGNAAPKKAAAKPVITKKPASAEQYSGKGKAKAAVRQSAGVYFSMDDLSSFFESKKNPAQEVKKFAESAAPAKKADAKAAPAKKVELTLPAPSKKPLGAASITDILGFNPAQQSREKYEEKDVPAKWKKYYKLLIDLRKKYSREITELSEDVQKRTSADGGGEMSAYGQHLGDAGSESLERDISFAILTDEKQTVAKIDAAIAKMKNGTYGICEKTGKPIPEARLLSKPYTRFSIEGRKLHENELRTQKIAARNALTGDTPDIATPADEDEPADR